MLIIATFNGWRSQRTQPVIIRIRAYLQTFIKVIRHISAAKNKIVDYLSPEDFTVNHLSYIIISGCLVFAKMCFGVFANVMHSAN